MLVADLATDAGQAAVVDRIADDERPIDLVVNNAGFGTSGAFHELDPDRLAEEIEVNVAALTRLSHAALSVMMPRGRGWLLNVSSVASFQPAPQLAVYAATKAYVTSLTESLHEEARGSGVHVTALCPGLTRTEFQRVSNTQHYSERVPVDGLDERRRRRPHRARRRRRQQGALGARRAVQGDERAHERDARAGCADKAVVRRCRTNLIRCSRSR